VRRWGNGCPLSKSINSRAATTVLAIFAPGVTYFLETAVPAAALTIDDGPDPDETPAILDVLRDHDAHATFFLIGSRIPGNDLLLATREDVDDSQTLQPNRLTAEQVHAPETVLDVAKGGKPGGPVVVRRGTIMLLEDPLTTSLLISTPKACAISWAIFRQPNFGFCRFIATTAAIQRLFRYPRTPVNRRSRFRSATILREG